MYQHLMNKFYYQIVLKKRDYFSNLKNIIKNICLRIKICY